MDYTYQMYDESAAYLKDRLTTLPKTALVLGSGLGDFADTMADAVRIPYEEIPHFHASTASSHKGVLVFGKLSGRDVVIMQGRLHYYEGYDYSDTVYPIRVLKLLGVEQIILTNAAGGINEAFAVGDLVAVSDHIKFFDESPMRGPNIEQFGPRFFDLSEAYDRQFRHIAVECAKEAGFHLYEGVYAYMPGPQFETPAEIRALRILGADLVGMSTVAEVIAARHCGMRVLCISCVSNMAAGMSGSPITDEEVVETAGKIKGKFAALIRAVVARIG